MLKSLMIDKKTDEEEETHFANQLTELCQLHHHLYGGDDNEVVIYS